VTVSRLALSIFHGEPPARTRLVLDDNGLTDVFLQLRPYEACKQIISPAGAEPDHESDHPGGKIPCVLRQCRRRSGSENERNADERGSDTGTGHDIPPIRFALFLQD
jgi:hypothetical protein